MPRRPSAAIAATPHPLISDERIQHLYVTLLRTKLLRQRNRLREAAAPLVAREAIVTGTVTHLEDGDAVMPVAGDRLAALARGHALRRVLAWSRAPRRPRVRAHRRSPLRHRYRLRPGAARRKARRARLQRPGHRLTERSRSLAGLRRRAQAGHCLRDRKRRRRRPQQRTQHRAARPLRHPC